MTIAKKVLTDLEHLPAEALQGLEGLFNSLEKDWNSLTPAAQQAAITGASIAQIIKAGYKAGAKYVYLQIGSKLGLTTAQTEGVLMAIAKDLGLNVTSGIECLDSLADKIQAGLTDNGWNALWQDIAQFGATYLATGNLSWVTLAMGVLEFAYQKYVKPKIAA